MFTRFKKIARFASCTALLSSVAYADEVQKPKRQMPFELTTNVTYSQLNYNMKTQADSILKWRDSSGLGFDGEIAKNFTNKFRGVAKFSYASLAGGVMSDYDLENAYPYGAGIFSETKRMTGQNFSWALLGGYNHINNEKHRLTFLFGYEGRSLILDPRGINQVGAENGGVGFVVEDKNILTQNVKAQLHGLQIGVDYLKNISDDYRIGATASAFLPLYYRSEQYNWGYGNNGHDWRMESTKFGQMGGLSLKLQNQIKISRSVWWNIYAFGNVLAINKPTEVDRRSDKDTRSDTSKNVTLTQFGIGTGFTFE